MKRLLKILAVVTAVCAAVWGAGLYLARRLEDGRGYSEADDFRVAAVWGGREFESTAAALRRGWARAVLGGVALDLREATLDPGGADVELHASMGGIALMVPPHWRVLVDRRVEGGEIQVRVPDPASLPAGAPELRVSASARNAGIVVSSGEDA